jgi:hypothetical protein
VVERLQHLSEERLAKLALATRSCIQDLADLAAQVEAQSDRRVPDIGLMGLGDQLAVMGNDLLTLGQESVTQVALERLQSFKRQLDSV